mgnify:CR=1 FL=1
MSEKSLILLSQSSGTPSEMNNAGSSMIGAVCVRVGCGAVGVGDVSIPGVEIPEQETLKKNNERVSVISGVQRCASSLLRVDDFPNYKSVLVFV